MAITDLKDSGTEEILEDVFPKRDPQVDDPEFVTLDSVISKAYTLYIEESGVPDKIFDLIIDNLTYMSFEDMQSGVRMLDMSQTVQFFESVFYMMRDGDISYLTRPRGMKVDKIVDVEEFVKSPQYMNQRRFVRPPIMKHLNELFHGDGSGGFVECVCGGAIGIGKNYFTDLGLAYVLYQLSCYHNPQMEFGLAPGSNIVFIIQSKTQNLAKKVAFKQFGARLRESPYFYKHFPYDPKALSELRFPNDIIVLPVSSSDTAALGMNTFGGLIDEMNFMAVIEKSARTATGESYDQAEKLYNTIIRRMKSRYNVMGKVPGKLFLISSANYPDAFIERKCQERERQLEKDGKSDIYVMRMAHWESYPPSKLSKERFLVEVGDDARPSRLIKSLDEALDVTSVLHVPMDYKKEFDADVEAAIRDIAGIPVGGSNVYIRQRDKITLAIETHKNTFEGNQLFTLPTLDLRMYENNLDILINHAYLEKLIDMNSAFALHLDNAVSEEGDKVGLSLAHLGGYKWVGRTTNYDPWLKYYVKCEPTEYPLIVVDGIMEIIPPVGDEIDIDLTSRFIQLLVSRLRIKTVTADQYQSAQLLQQLKRCRNILGEVVKTGVVSVDKTIAPYAEIKQAFRDERILMPYHEKCFDEFKKLMFDPKKFKVDHPAGGSKDIADAVTGAAYVVSMGERKQLFKRIGERRRANETSERRELRRNLRTGVTRDRRWYR